MRRITAALDALVVTRWRKLFVAFVLGGVAALGLAPFDLWMLVPLAFAALLYLVHRIDGVWRSAAVLWAGGTGYFAVALHWIVEPFFVDAATHGWMAPFALAFLAGGLALFWGLAGALAARLVAPGAARFLALAGLLCLVEYARAHVLTGLPWAHPGHSLIATQLVQLAAWIGPHGLTALVFSQAAALAYLMRCKSLGGFLRLYAVCVGAAFVPLAGDAPATPDEAPTVRLVQPNAPQDQKWLPEMIPVFFERGLDLTAAEADPPPDLVIWPETSLPVLLSQSASTRVRMVTASGGAPMMVGAQDYDGSHVTNALGVIDGQGAFLDIYDKHHLVPFGEYLPFEGMLSQLGLQGLAAVLPGGFRSGPGPRVIDLPDGLGRVFPMICYEAIFPGYIRAVERPDWMAHVTNDAWFGNFSGPYQHLALARLRAVEQGLPVLRAANTGVSAVIDARGRVVDSLPLGEAGIIDAPLPAALPPTPYARLGDWPTLLVVIFATAITLLVSRRRTPLQRPH